MICRACGAQVESNAQTCPQCGQQLAPRPPAGQAMTTLIMQSSVESLWPKRYRLEHILGKGGMGAVYKAYDGLLDRWVAIKVIQRDYLLFQEDEDVVKQRFESEIKSTGRLIHPNIVTLYDALDTENQYYLIMELIEGLTLKELLKKEKTLSLPRTFAIARDIAKGLHYAHINGIIHRDVKPANIMVSTDNVVKIMDFGIAKFTTEGFATITTPGQILGSPPYLAPERIRGKAYDHRSDIFSLACIVYEMLTGDRPFGGKNRHEVVHNIVTKQAEALTVKLPGFQPEYDLLVQRALAKEPSARFATAAEFADALDSALASLELGAIGLSNTLAPYLKPAQETSELTGEVSTALHTETAIATSPTLSASATLGSLTRSQLTARTVAWTSSTLRTLTASVAYHRRYLFWVLLPIMTLGLMIVSLALGSQIFSVAFINPYLIWERVFAVSRADYLDPSVAAASDLALIKYADALAALTSDNLLRAKELTHEALTLNPLNSKARILAAYLDYQEAVSDHALLDKLQEYWRKDRGEPIIGYLLALTLHAMANDETAYAVVSEALLRDPDNEYLLGIKAKLLLAFTQDESAKLALTKVQALNPASAFAFNHLAILALNRAAASDALQYITLAAQVNTTDAGIQWNKALLEMRFGDPAKELAAWRKFLALDSADRQRQQILNRVAALQSTLP